MRLLPSAALVLTTLVSLAVPAQADQTQLVRYDCDLHGAIGKLVANVSATREKSAPDAIVPDTTVTFYEGELRSPAKRYRFTGRNENAEFTDLERGERLCVQMNTIPDNTLVMTVDPYGSSPSRHRCVPSATGVALQ